jgi:hypothetical protein
MATKIVSWENILKSNSKIQNMNFIINTHTIFTKMKHGSAVITGEYNFSALSTVLY